MNTINPYSPLGPKIKAALDLVIASLPLNPTFDNLNDALFNALFAGNLPSDDLVILYVKSVLPNVYNAYSKTSPSVPLLRGEGGHDGNTSTGQSGNLAGGLPASGSPLLEGEGPGVRSYNEKQRLIINDVINSLRTTSAESIPQLLTLTDEKIAASGLTIAEQAPLFVATTAGRAGSEYWLLQIPQPSAWAAYMVNPAITPQAMDALNYANVSSWVSASMQGALLAWGSINLPKIEFVDMMAAYAGATGMAAGKVVFKW